MHMESFVMFPMIMNSFKKYGKIDIVVCNAAANPFTDPILSSKEVVLDKLWEINVKSSILLLQDVALHLEKGSSVIFITSIAGFQPQGAMAMYGVTKTALLGLTKALAAEMGPDTRVKWLHPVLASKDASYITRETLVVAGGMPSRL